MAHHHSTTSVLQDLIPHGGDAITCFIAGFRYHEGLDITPYLVPGEALDLIAEPGNPYDEHAVRLEHRKSRIGYVPRAHNQQVARWMGQGHALRARITAVDWQMPPWEAVQIEIALCDPPPMSRPRVGRVVSAA